MTLREDLENLLKKELAVPGTGDLLIDDIDYPASWTEELQLRYRAAVRFAQAAHRGVCRKGTEIPYVLHPVEASMIVLGMTEDLDVVTAAVLHDVVEDTDFTAEDIRVLFGERVAELVASESEDKMKNLPAEESWKARKQATIDHLKSASREAKIICLGDKLSNIRFSVKTHAKYGDAMWKPFNQNDPAMQGWYYYSVGAALGELRDTGYWQEFEQCCDEVFGGRGKE